MPGHHLVTASHQPEDPRQPTPAPSLPIDAWRFRRSLDDSTLVPYLPVLYNTGRTRAPPPFLGQADG